MITVDMVSALPLTKQMTIPEDFMDEMGHMNIMYYVHIFNQAAWRLFGSFGVDFDYVEKNNEGMFALEQHIRYLAEVHVGEQVVVRSRVLGVSAKRIHFMHFMVNATTGKLASTFEVLGSYADLNLRRTAHFPPDIASNIMEKMEEHQQLEWDAPVCGVLKP